MAGERIELFGKRTFDLSDVAGGAALSVVVVDRVPTEDDDEAVLLVRLHEADIAGGTVRVIARACDPSMEDPTRDFVATSTLGIVAFTTTAAAPALGLATLDLAGVGALRIEFSASQSAGGGSLSAGLSAELLLRRREDA